MLLPKEIILHNTSPQLVFIHNQKINYKKSIKIQVLS